MTDKQILLGRILTAHGLKGEVKLKSFTADPLALARYELTARDGRVFKLTKPRMQGEAVIAGIKGITDRTTAETLRGLDLYIDRADLPKPGKDEFYHSDLLGLTAVDEGGRELGTIIGLHNFGGGDVIELKRKNGRAGSFLSFTKAVVPTVDVAAGRIVVSAEGVEALEEAERPKQKSGASAGKGAER